MVSKQTNVHRKYEVPEAPDELIIEIMEGRCVLFGGAGLSANAGFPMWPKLMSMMIDFCKKNGIEIDLDSIECLTKGKKYDLITEHLREEMGDTRFQKFMKKTFDIELEDVPSTHQTIKTIPFSQAITTNYDRLFEKIYPHAKVTTILNTRDSNEMTRINEFYIFKIHGTIDHFETVVLGKSEYSELIYNNPLFIDTLSFLLRSKTFLFVGYSLSDPYLMNLLEKIKKTLKLGPVHYLFTSKNELNDLLPKMYKKHYNIIIIPYDPVDNHIVVGLFLDKLSKSVKQKVKKDIKLKLKEEERIPIKAPYKFLNHFETSDKDIFYGRYEEINAFTQLIENSRVSLLFGKSGVGKTSFILAGMFSKLSSKNDIPIYVRCTDNPLNDIRESILSAIEKIVDKMEFKSDLDKQNFENKITTLGRLKLMTLLKEVNKLVPQTPVLFIDQFEEFFITLSPQTRKEFTEFLKKIVYNFSINFKLIFSFREDFFVEFNEMGNLIPDIFNYRFRLMELSKENAKEAITKPLEYFELSMQEELTDIIIEDLVHNNVIEPAQLQIVCFNLYNTLSTGENEIMRDNYISLGGVKGILTDYVDYALEHFPQNRRKIAKEIMKSMISAKKTKIPLKRTEIQSLTYKGALIGEDDIQWIIRELINKRLIERKKGEDEEIYELTHEYLINKIHEWIDIEAYKVKEAQDMLRQEENHWKNYSGIMEKYKYEFINLYKEKLILDSYKKALLLRTSLEYPNELEYWTQQNLDNPLAIQFLENTLDHHDKSVRRNGCITLLQFNIDSSTENEIIEILKDVGNPNVITYLYSLRKKFCNISDDLIIKVKEAVECRYTRNMAFVREGKFIMGRDENEVREIIDKGAHESWFSEEFPKREKYVSSILIDKSLVTNEEYKEFNPEHTFPKGSEKKPATNVSWHDAKKYAEWLDKNIPNEEEWEKAARGTDGRLFPWGNKWDPTKCNTRLSGIAGKTDIDRYPNGVSPNGCYDMAGNVWEWTDTWKEKNKTVIVRGGSWSKFGILPWCSYRFDYEANEGQQNVGFRCIRRIANIRDTNKVYSAGGVIFRKMHDNIEVIICKTRDPLEWRIPKGMLNKDENVEECVIREVLEETGFTIKIRRFIDFATWSYLYQGKIWDETALFFVLELESNEQKNHDDEFSGVKWVPVTEAINMLHYIKEKEILKKGLNFYKKLKN